MFDPVSAISMVKSLPWKKILIVIGIVILVTGVVTLIKEYGDAQYEAGQLAEKQEWLDAQKEFLDDLDDAEAVADAKATERIQEWNDKVAEEREEIKRAEDEGKSVFDVMFR